MSEDFNKLMDELKAATAKKKELEEKLGVTLDKEKEDQPRKRFRKTPQQIEREEKDALRERESEERRVATQARQREEAEKLREPVREALKDVLPTMKRVRELADEMNSLEREVMSKAKVLEQSFRENPELYRVLQESGELGDDVEGWLKFIRSASRTRVMGVMPTGRTDSPTAEFMEEESIFDVKPTFEEMYQVLKSKGRKVSLNELRAYFGSGYNTILGVLTSMRSWGIVENDFENLKTAQWSLTVPTDEQMYYYIKEKPRSMLDLRERFKRADGRTAIEAAINLVLKPLVKKGLVREEKRFTYKGNTLYYVLPEEKEITGFLSVEPKHIHQIRSKFGLPDLIIAEYMRRLADSGRIDIKDVQEQPKGTTGEEDKVTIRYYGLKGAFAPT